MSHKSNSLEQYLDVPTDVESSFEGLAVSGNYYAALALKEPFANTSDATFEGALTNLKNLLIYGKAGTYRPQIKPFAAAHYLAVEKVGYGKVRTLVIPKAPGFNANLYRYLKLIEPAVKSLIKLPDELKSVRVLIAGILNGVKVADSHTGIPAIKGDAYGVDPHIREAMKAFYEKNQVTETLFGKLFSNIKDYRDSHELLIELSKVMKDVDWYGIDKATESFKSIIEDLRGKDHNLTAASAADIVKVSERLASAISFSAAIQHSLPEIESSFNAIAGALESKL